MRLPDLRVVFCGTPEFAVPSLEALYRLECPVIAVVSQPDKPQGRGQRLTRTPVAACADAHGTPVHAWPRLNDESYGVLRGLAPDLMVVAAYGRILPQRYLDLPAHGCLNVHASVLPALRGAAPIQWAVLRGHLETGVSIMKMAAGLDTGDVGWVRRTPIGPDETSGALTERLAELGAVALSEALQALVAGELRFTPQDPERATLAPKLDREVGRVDFGEPAAAVHDRVRGASPWPGAFVDRAEGPLKIHRTRVSEGEGEPGLVLAHDPDGPRIACGAGAVTLLSVQRPGRNPVDGAAFLRGAVVPVGARLDGGA